MHSEEQPLAREAKTKDSRVNVVDPERTPDRKDGISLPKDSEPRAPATPDSGDTPTDQPGPTQIPRGRSPSARPDA